MTEPLLQMERAFFERLALVRSGGDSIRRSMATSSFYAAVEAVRAKGNGGSNRTAVKKVLLRAEIRLPRGGFFFSAAGQIQFNYSYCSRWLLAIFQPAEYFL